MCLMRLTLQFAVFEEYLRRSAEEEAVQVLARQHQHIMAFAVSLHVAHLLQARAREDLLRIRLSDSEQLVANMMSTCAQQPLVFQDALTNSLRYSRSVRSMDDALVAMQRAGTGGRKHA
jgi:hypothetical protein